MPGRFAQLHVALYHGLEHQVAKMPPHLVPHLIGQSQTAVIHGEQEALDLQFLIEP